MTTLHPIRSLLVTGLALGLGAGAVLGTVGTASAAATVDRVSVSTGEEQADNVSGGGIPSEDGRFVAFSSNANNLSPQDTNFQADGYVRDRVLGTTELISIGTDGAASGAVVNDISADGRYVVFTSSANDLVANDYNGMSDVFIRDRVAGTTEVVSVASDGTLAQQRSLDASVSKDGRYVAFTSFAPLADQDSSSANQDVYVRDRVAGSTTLVSITLQGGESGGKYPSISDNGQFVSFTAKSKQLVKGDKNKVHDIFVRDLAKGKSERISVSSKGVEASKRSFGSQIAGWGRYVVFTTAAGNLVKGDSDGKIDVFVHDRRKDKTQLVSVDSAERPSKGPAFSPSISSDGRYVTFHAAADLRAGGKTTDSLYLRDRNAGTTRSINNRIGVAGSRISGNGAVVVFDAIRGTVVPGDTNNLRDVFAYAR